MIEPGDVERLLQGFDPEGDGEAAKSRELTMALLASTSAPFSRRQYAPGHITCTGLVFSPGGDAILLVFHRRLRRWLLPGGHVETGDPGIADVARREVIEETGAILRQEARPTLAGVDVHGIPPRPDEPFHLHHDLIFAFDAESGVCRPSEEAREAVWCAVGEFDRYQLPGSIRRSFARAAVRH